MRKTILRFRVLSLAATLALLWAPVLVVVVYSFNDGRQALVWQGFSLRWYRTLVENPAFFDALGLSLLIALLTAATSTVLGASLALAFRMPGPRSWRPLRTLLVLPLVIPDIVLGVSLSAFYSLIRMPTGWWTVYFAHTSFATAFVYVVVASRLSGYSFELEKAASDLGARPAQTFTTVTLPALAPALLTSALIAFTLSLDDTVVALFTSGVGSTVMSVLLFSMTRLGVSPAVNALATILLALVLSSCGFVLLVQSLARRKEA